MKRIIDAYFLLLKGMLVLCLAGMVVLVFGNVVLRYVFNSGIATSEEVSRILFVYGTFLGAIVALRERRHLGVDTLLVRLSPAGRRLCAVAAYGLMLLASCVVLVGSWSQTLINWSVKMPVTGLSMALQYGVGVVFSISAICILLVELARVLRGVTPDTTASQEDAMVLEQLQPEHAGPGRPGPRGLAARSEAGHSGHMPRRALP
ncbi:TRAP transporter small permease [Bordetella sp. 2513F-2]